MQGFVLAEERVKKSHDSYSSGIGAFASARIAKRPGGRRYAVVGPSRHGLRAIVFASGEIEALKSYWYLRYCERESLSSEDLAVLMSAMVVQS